MKGRHEEQRSISTALLQSHGLLVQQRRVDYAQRNVLFTHYSLLITHQAQRSAHHFHPALHAVAIGVGEEVVVYTSGLTGSIPLIVVGGRVEYFLAPA